MPRADTRGEIGIRVEGLRFSRGAFSLEVPWLEVSPGEKVAIMGENGSGKTTLLTLIGGFLSPDDGCVEVGGEDLVRLSPRQRARILAFLPQVTSVVFPFTVYQLVLMGRYPHLVGRKPGPGDVQTTLKTMRMLGLEDMSDRRYLSLSGGEQRRVMLAKVLNQGTPVILLDEPVAMLDARHSLTALTLLSCWEGTVVAVVHDINLALPHFRRFLFMREGQILYDVYKEDVNSEILSEVYDVRAYKCWAFGFSLPGEDRPVLSCSRYL
ncbi:MAG: ABC transporter ATP-binding protein [Aquificota bacterium]|nr:MAG: ABC transporter ATP-binding protein [Aquificota bacterium]